MKGGSLKPHEVKDFLQASYERDAPMNIDGYVLDEKLSNLLTLTLDPGYKLTPRYRTAVKMYQDAMNKYQGYKFELVGHSQSAIIVNKLC